MWRSLVAHLLWEQGVGSSNLPIPTHLPGVLQLVADLIRMRTREGMAVARAQGKLKGRQPNLSPMQQRELKRMHQTGEYTISDLGELFSVSRPTVYRTIRRATT
jgi:DNA invertase Pin-like site-specific DNA recombinase